MKEMEDNLHPRRLQPLFQSCYKLSPSTEALFRLLQAYISNGDELVRSLPTGFHAMDIFDHQLDQIVNLQSAENGKIYIFTNLNTYENGLHNCKSIDGSWEKQRLIYKERDRSVQLATFHTKLKQRTIWGMELYTFHDQKIALCAIYNTNAKRKPGSSDMYGIKKSKPSDQENMTSFQSRFGGDSQDVGLVVDFPSPNLLPHPEYIAGSFHSYEVGSTTGLLDDIVHQNIVTDTVGLIKPTTETSPPSLDSIDDFNFDQTNYRHSWFDQTNIDDFNFGFPLSETSSFSVGTDSQNMEAVNDMIDELLEAPSCETGIGAGRLSQGCELINSLWKNLKQLPFKAL